MKKMYKILFIVGCAIHVSVKSTDWSLPGWTTVRAPSMYVGTCVPVIGAALKQEDGCADWCGGSRDNVLDTTCSQNELNCRCKPGVVPGSHNIFNKIEDFGNSVVKGWEAKRDLGRKLLAGADMIEDAPNQLQTKAVAGLQTALVNGLQNSLIKVLVEKTGDIADKRAQIATFKKMVEDNKGIADAVGKASLVDDLIKGLTAADEALALVWSGPNINSVAGGASSTASSSGTSAIDRMRQRVKQEAKKGAIAEKPEYQNKVAQLIKDNKNSGALGALLNTSQESVTHAQAAIKQISQQVDMLRRKIYSGQDILNRSSLPSRMRSLGNFLKV